MKITVDYDLCESYGVCMDLAPDVFHIDDDEQLQLLKTEVADELIEPVRNAARRCPKAAITLHE
jgi:ferredoxin